MTSVFYLIACVNLLYSFDQAFTTYNTYNKPEDKLQVFLNSITIENQDEYLAKIINPLKSMTYDKQLEKKQKISNELVNMIVERAGSEKNLMTYKIRPIIPSPVLKAYRNKDIFYIRRGVDGNQKTVGCTLGSHKYGKMFAVRPTKITTIRESHKRVAQVYEDFIRSSSISASIQPFDDGFWNILLVRSSEEGDVMASVTVKPKGYTNEVIQKEQKALMEYFFKHLPNISLFYQECPVNHCMQHESPFILLYGKQYLMETFNGYLFKIAPDSVFPCNKLGAEKFYATLIKIANLTRTTVLDICCGTGINSIMVSKVVRQTFGFETISDMITEAKYSAYLNNILNVNFETGRIYNNLISVLNSLHPSSDVVVILNHRRNGLGQEIIQTIRSSKKISRVVYLYFKNNSPNAIRNFISLCSDNNSTFAPFRLTEVIPFDLLPQTHHTELIFLFQRDPIIH